MVVYTAAAAFLNYHEAPSPSDAIVLFIGPDYYENTHVEELEAKKMMDAAGLTSAIFVSSPYHMRRISMISKAVFQDEKYRLTFRGSRYIQTKGFFSLFRRSKIQKVFEEYLKIAVFLAYHAYEKALA